MINFDGYTNESKTEHNLEWPYIPDHPYSILIIGVQDLKQDSNKCIIEFNKKLTRH